MKIASNSITYLVAFIFLVIGADYFFNYIPKPPLEGNIEKYMGLMSGGYMAVVKALEIIFAIMLFANFKRQLTWLLLLPIVVNILMFEVFIAKQPGLGVVLLALNFFMIYVNRDSYKGII